MRREVLCFLLLMFCVVNLKAQNNYFNKLVKELADDKYNGRGYTYDGMRKASAYLSNEFKSIGLKPFTPNYYQQVKFPINIIEEASLKLNGKDLIYGKDYIVKPSSKSVSSNQKLDIYYFPVEDYIESFQSNQKTKDFVINDYYNQKGKNIILPPIQTKVDSIGKYYKQWANNYETEVNDDRAVFRFVSDSLTASLSQRQANVAEFVIKEKHFKNDLIIDDFSVKTTFKSDFEFNNVIGYLDGENNDSVIVITSHYDHLGRVGNAIFPGASDNASGTAMVLDLAKYYSKHKPKYKMVFMLFGAEEAGIVGSFNYVENPLFDLGQIKFLVNLDIMGAGEEGIQVVNGTKYKSEFDQLVRINQNQKLLKQVKVRGESCNSDHCPFDKKGVPSFFIYTLGGKGNYHNIYDTYSNLDLSNAPKVKQLLISFVNKL